MAHGGRVYEYQRVNGFARDEILDFSANIHPFGPPKNVLDAIIAGIEGIRDYPDSEHTAVKAVLAKRFGVRDGNIICGNGASEMIDIAFRNLRPMRTFVLEPAFSEYEAAAKRAESTILHCPLGTDRSLSAALSAMDADVQAGDACVVNNPHNPTGSCWRRNEWFEMIRRWLMRGVNVIMDESFLDFRCDADDITSISLIQEYPTLLVIRSATKMYAIPGLRFGFGVGHASLISRLDADRDGWSVNHLAQTAAQAAYQNDAYEAETWAWLKTEQEYIQQTWGRHPYIQLYLPSVNYFLVRFRDIEASRMIRSGLQHQGILIRDCTNFRTLGAEYARIAIRSHSENERLWNAVSSLLDLIH